MVTDYTYLHFGPVLCGTSVSLDLCKELLERGEKTKGVRKHKATETLSTKLQLQSDYTHEDKLWFIEKFKPYFVPYFKKLQDENYYGMRFFNRILLKSMWINYMKKDEFNRPHTHSPNFSFCLYLTVPDEINKEIETFKGTGLGPGTVSFFYGEDQKGIVTAHGIKPVVGDLWMFPAVLRHMVPPFRSDVTRISVSGNFTISDELFKGQPIQPNEFILNNYKENNAKI